MISSYLIICLIFKLSSIALNLTIEDNFKILKGKGLIETNFDYIESFYLKNNDTFKCASRCFKINDCNMAYLKENNCIIFRKCQIRQQFSDESNSKIIHKKKQCLRNYSILNSKF